VVGARFASPSPSYGGVGRTSCVGVLRDDEMLSTSVTGSDPASVADELSAPFRHRLGLEM
jgi:hypothetical protein